MRQLFPRERAVGIQKRATKTGTLLAIQWLFIATIAAFVSASTSIVAVPIWGTVSANTAFYAAAERIGLWINLALYGVPLLLLTTIAHLRTRWWKGALVLLILLPLLLGALTSGRALALLTLIAVLIPSCWLGQTLIRCIDRKVDRATAWTLGAANGIGIIGIVGFTLGIVGLLRPLLLWSLLLATIVGLLVSPARGRLRDDLMAMGHAFHRPIALTPPRVLLTGLLVSTAWSVTIGALTPETASDAVRQRTPAAIDFASTRHLTVKDGGILVSAYPSLGEALYATLIAVGPIPIAKLLALVTGALCVVLVLLIGRRLGGHRAGELAAFSFATIPLVIWLGQTAYLDLFTCLAALAATLSLLTPRVPDRTAALTCGLWCGWGIAVKLHFGYVAIGLGITLLVLVLTGMCTRRTRVRHAITLGLIFGASAAAVVIMPLARSALLLGQLPGLALTTQSLSRTNPTALGDLAGFGFGRDLHALLLLPLNLTINSLGFEWVPTPWGPFNGLLGYVPLALAPLLLVARPERRMLALCSGLVVAGLFWFYSAQYLRYALPIVALLCPLGAAAFEAIRRTTSARFGRVLIVLALLPALAGVAVQARVPTYGLDFVLGRQSATAYLDRYLFCCAGAPILALLDAQPDVARAYALYDPPRLYSHTSIDTSLAAIPGSRPLDATEADAVLAALDAGGYTHLIVSRRYLPPEWDRSPLLDETFLRRYTVLVGNGPNTYLYRILPSGGRETPVPWTVGPELLTATIPAAKQLVAHSLGTTESAAALDDTAIQIDRGTTWQASAPARAGQRYLLDTASRHATPAPADDSQATLTFRLEWRDEAGQLLGIAASSVPVSKARYHHFSLVASAPTGTTTVTVALIAPDIAIRLITVSLREAAGGVEAGIGP